MSAYDVTLASAGRSLAKQATIIDGIVTRVDDPPWPRLMKFAEVWIAGPDDLLAVLSAAAGDDSAPCVVRAAPLEPTGRRAIRDDPEKGPAGLKPADRAWAGLDFDSIPADGIDPLREPEKAVAKIRVCLPPEHHDTTVVWQITASAGKKLDKLHLRLWFLYDKPLHGRQLETWV